MDGCASGGRGSGDAAGHAGGDDFEWFTKLLDDEAEYEKMAHAANPYGDGHACERIADVLEGKEYGEWKV